MSDAAPSVALARLERTAYDKGEWAKEPLHWVENGVACVSVVFTWQLPKAREICQRYVDRGFYVRAGGPGVFVRKNYLSDIAEVGGSLFDAVKLHNPRATFASRGCPVGCFFCIVPKMEGLAFTEIDDFPVRPVLCDNNLSALPSAFQQHIVSRYLHEAVPLLDANSGFEPTTFDEEVFRRWSPILKGSWRFGYDESGEGAAVEKVMKMLGGISARRKQVYVMIGHEPFAMCMDRLLRVIGWGGEPYAQPYIKLNALEKKPNIRHDWTELKLRQVQRWVNRRIWRYAKFEDYDSSIRSPAKK